MRIPALFLAAALACAAAAPAAAQPSTPPVTGTYDLVEVNGAPFTGEAEGEPGWLIAGGVVTLLDDGRILFEVRAHRAGEPVETRNAAGRYTRTGDSITVRMDEKPDIEDPFRFVFRDGVLRGTDANGKSLAFRRRES